MEAALRSQLDEIEGRSLPPHRRSPGASGAGGDPAEDGGLLDPADPNSIEALQSRRAAQRALEREAEERRRLNVVALTVQVRGCACARG